MITGSMSASKRESYLPYAITFAAGASYGLTTVVVGQPLDTIKTRMQGISKTAIGNASTSSATTVFFDLYQKEGVRGLYRGGLPLMIGGGLMRSAQFGVRYVKIWSLHSIRQFELALSQSTSDMSSSPSAEAKGLLQRYKVPNFKIFGAIDSQQSTLMC